MEKIEKPFQTTDNTLHVEPRSREDLERREAKEAAWQQHFKEECTENGAHCAATEAPNTMESYMDWVKQGAKDPPPKGGSCAARLKAVEEQL